MKIAMVTATFPPYRAGTGTVVYHNARILSERGHKVEVFTAADASASYMHYPYPVHFLRPLFRIGNAPMTMSLLWELRRFDLIHLHYPYIFGSELVQIASLMWGTPYVVTYHNRLVQTAGGWKERLFKVYNVAREPAVLKGAAAIFAVSLDHLTSINSLRDATLGAFEVPNGVDTNLFCPGNQRHARTMLNISETAFVVLFVGALDSAHLFKNVPGLIDAFSMLEGSPILLVAGSGNMKDDYERYAATKGCLERVHFLGNKSPEELVDVYRAADVTALPSTEVESFGVVLIESMACGTPVVASRLPGVRGVVDHNVDGVLTEPGDTKDLVRALCSLRHDPSWARALGDKGTQKAKQRYSWDVVVDSLERRYEATSNRQ